MREAACLGTTEIFLRVVDSDKDSFRSYAQRFADTLLIKLKDPYWGVRVQSAQALSHVIKAYKEDL